MGNGISPDVGVLQLCVSENVATDIFHGVSYQLPLLL
jgi:hypothetical protein